MPGGPNAAVVRLGADGKPGERCGGVDQSRKAGHCMQPTPHNRFVYVPHVKGNNALFQYAFDEATGSIVPLAPLDVGPPEGSGPRHVAYHSTLPVAYFSEEQGLGVSVYERAADGRLTLRSRPRPQPDVAAAPPLAGSSIVLTPDARHLFMGIRDFAGAGDLIAAYRVIAEGR